MQGELVALEVPRGSGYDSQSSLNNLFPHVYNRLTADGCGRLGVQTAEFARCSHHWGLGR